MRNVRSGARSPGQPLHGHELLVGGATHQGAQVQPCSRFRWSGMGNAAWRMRKWIG